MTTLKDVGARAGVSVSAVSRVLRDVPGVRIRPETRERIRAAAAELGYRPNFAGRALRSSRSHVIALVVPDLANPVFSELMRGVEQTALAGDDIVVLGHAEDMQPGGATLARLAQEGRIDGMLVQPAADAGNQLQALAALPCPVVLVNAAVGGFASVRLPDEAASACAVDHLIDLGHRRIAFAGGGAGDRSSLRREAGFRAASERGGVAVVERLVRHDGYTPAAGRTVLHALESDAEPPTAVVVANVNAAIGMLGEAHRSGYRIPDDLSVVAVHDVWTAENTGPPLTCVRMPLFELGVRAVEMLTGRIAAAGTEGGLSSECAGGDDAVVTAPVRLVHRESTASPRRSDARV